MKKSVVSNSIIFLSTLLLLKVSWLFLILNLFLLLVIFASYKTIANDSNWIFGFLLIGNSKRVYTDYGNNFWVTILREKEDYYAYLLEDKMFHCKVVERRINYNGNIEDLKITINRKLDNYCGGVKREREREKRVSENFKKWDGCLTKEDSRDKKISNIC